MSAVSVAFWTIVALLLLGLSLPPAIRCRSWKRFFLAFFISFAGIVFPLFIFLFSAFLLPDWKGGARFGWVDCFHFGKLYLLPLVLWANAGLYSVQVHSPGSKPRTWAVLGVLSGAIVSVVCLVFGLAVHSFVDFLQWWLIVPLYVAVWYSVLFIRLYRSYPLDRRAYLYTLLGSTPLWGIGIAASRINYNSLPDHPPSCFVVTATLRGHQSLIGPLCEVYRDGVKREASRQLLVFWQVESLWSSKFPRCHRIFRKCYNRIGPRVAALVRTSFAADVLYIFLKPFELLAYCVLLVVRRRKV